MLSVRENTNAAPTQNKHRRRNRLIPQPLTLIQLSTKILEFHVT